MNKQQALDQIAKDIEVCALCKKEKNGMAVPGEGNPDADIIFIGEAPGKTEAKTGRPFVGRSGQLLRSLIREVGLLEEDVFITSPVKYLPDRGTPTSEDIAHGRIHLMQQFAVIDPKIIVLMGRVASEGVLQQKLAVMSQRGTIIEKGGKKFFLTIHPAAAIRFQKFKKLIIEDFEKLKELLALSS
ncbi:MAG: uracil-DNA glycosylase [Candidatus Levybacteria bacterium]|nr:uracil-DNA glycosylase [Candidatus Levybacteria bacterium]